MLAWASGPGTQVCDGAAACSTVIPSKLLDPSVPPFPCGKWGPAPSLLQPLACASPEPLKMEHVDVRALNCNYSCKVLGVINDTARRRRTGLCFITCRQALFR